MIKIILIGIAIVIVCLLIYKHRTSDESIESIKIVKPIEPPTKTVEHNDFICPKCGEIDTANISLNDGGSRLCSNCGLYHHCFRENVYKPGDYSKCGCREIVRMK